MFGCKGIMGCVTGVLLWATAAGAHAAPRTWLAHDFFVEQASVHASWSRVVRPRATDCRAHIKKSLCVMKQSFNREQDLASRDCAEHPEKYVAFFEAVYDRFPAVLQQVFCSLDTLAVEPNLESIAYAGLRGGGAIMGFRKSVIDEGLDLETLLSWKEQLPFGGARDSYKLSDELPLLSITSGHGDPSQDLAFYILAHEFGHLLDFANDLNTICWPGMGCHAQRGSWTALSWTDTDTPKQSQDFPWRSNICFYNCSSAPIAKRHIAALYDGLHDSNFVTLYAATNIYDDLAESLAFYYLQKDGGFEYALDTRQGKTWDLLSKLQASQFASKLQYLDAFLQREDIAYP